MSDMSEPLNPAPQLTVMTVNIHKGFTTFNRKFILPELRDAVRKVGADVVFMQEVLGMHDAHGKRYELHWYEGMGHGFAEHPPDADLPAEQRAAAELSHDRSIDFLWREVGPQA